MTTLFNYEGGFFIQKFLGKNCPFWVYLLVMEKGIQKFIKKMLLKKYPFYLDVYVTKTSGYSKFQSEHCHEVFLVFFEKDLGETWGAREYIDELSRYMGILICGVYNEIVTEEEWEQIKSETED